MGRSVGTDEALIGQHRRTLRAGVITGLVSLPNIYVTIRRKESYEGSCGGFILRCWWTQLWAPTIRYLGRGRDRQRPDCKYPYEQNIDGGYVRADVHAPAQDPEQSRGMYPIGRRSESPRGLRALSTVLHHGTLKAKGHGSSKWGLLNEVSRIVEYVEPDVVVTEERTPGEQRRRLRFVHERTLVPGIPRQ